MASLHASDQLPATSLDAIRDFNERHLAVISATPADAWADRFRLSVSSPLTTFPIALMSTKFNETKEEAGRFRTMAEKTFDLKVVEFDAGYEAKLFDITTNVFSYRNWSAVPERFARARARHVCKQLATLLEAGTSTTSPWDDVNFFSTSHLANPSNAAAGTWSNYQSSGTAPETLANVQTEMTSMRAVKDENGDKMGVEPDEIWLPTAKFQIVSDKLSQEYLASGESNYLRGKLRPVHVPELTDANDWYLVDSKLISMGVDPMVAAEFTPPTDLGLRFWDESSDFFKDTGKIKVSNHIWMGFKLVFPHAIRKVVGA